MKSHLPEKSGLHCLEGPILLPIRAHQQTFLGMVGDKEDKSTAVVDDVNILRTFFIGGDLFLSSSICTDVEDEPE